MTAWFRFVSSDPRRYRILLLDAMTANARFTSRALTVNRDFVGMTRNILLMLFPDGEKRFGLNGHYVSQGIVGLNLSMAQRWAHEGFKTPLEDIVRNAMVFYRGLAAFEKAERADAGGQGEGGA